MLEEIRIQGLGVIADATVPLSPGLTVVTGETGAGKTMVVTGLHLLFGGRGDSGRVRSGADRAWVEGRLRQSAGSTALTTALAAAEQAGAELDEDGSLIVSRSIGVDGRSRAHLGGRAVPLGVLVELAADVLAVHGQSAQVRLLRPADQRAALDRYGAATVAGPAGAYAEAFHRWRAAVDTMTERAANARELALEAALLRRVLDQVEALDPQPDEDDRLAAEAGRLAHADLLQHSARTAHEALVGDPAGEAPDVSGLLAAARRTLAAATEHDGQLVDLDARLAEIGYLVADTGTELASYAERIESDPARLAQVNERRAALQGLLRQHGDTAGGARSVDDLLTLADRAARRLLALDTSEEALQALADERDEAQVLAARTAAELTAARHDAARRFAAAVTAELGGLAMPDAEVRAEVGPRPVVAGQPTLTVDGVDRGAGPEGTDDVQLLLAAHPGAPLLPLQRGASGGELSRVMLAVEVVFAGADPVPVLVFDEVDAGVGGRAAVEVGRRLARLARDHQVVVVTHLPQVAAYADTHLVVDKTAAAGVTDSAVRRLDEAGRAVELARMLAGVEGSEHARRHASELIEVASRDKSDR